MKETLLIILAIILVIDDVGAQINATTDDGKKVILNNDMTWHYIQSDSKSIQIGDCKTIISTTSDKMTGKVMTTAPPETIILSTAPNLESGIGLRWLLLSDKTLVLSITAVGDGCIDDNTQINLLFKDDTRHQFFANNKFNCEGRATVYFGGLFGKKKELKMFREKEISTIRIQTRKSFIQEDLSDEQAQLFKAAINCLFSENVVSLED
jgi:hypothetical protein